MDGSVGAVVERALPEALHSVHRLTGLPVVFAGPTHAAATGRQLEITRLSGTLGTSLKGLRVPSGLGLGGTVIRDARPYRVDDYARADRITHDYDDVVVGDERLTSICAVPVLVGGVVRAVLYGAVRDGQPIGDRAMRATGVVAARIEREAERSGHHEGARPLTPAAIDELAGIIRRTRDEALRHRLEHLRRELSATCPQVRAPAVRDGRRLSAREGEVLRLVAVGASNLEIAAELRLSPETVKAYLRSAMRKLDAPNRTAAVHAARLFGVL
ncbi:helix-turn-helix transcriptional regulator [Virgisporangium aliadipatigenens]|uniref:Helix-turn-helix transcriptional regulator n=1 Tax=Virgisporangium aliadipatigenens TaxID=741659 RepID=A0A8J3YRW9_9ACTN|nr:helix-turn-helix transcriptional regulator [Virgisporangium aliadipatigenens]